MLAVLVHIPQHSLVSLSMPQSFLETDSLQQLFMASVEGEVVLLY